MHKYLLPAAVGCLAFATAASADRYDAASQVSAQLTYAFGGAERVAAPLNLALQLDQKHGYSDVAAPALFRLDVNGAGSTARVIGLPIRSTALRLGQFEDEEMADEGAEAAERGWFDFVDFQFSEYTWKDWTMLGASAVVVGYAGNELLSDDDGGGAPAEEEPPEDDGEICIEPPICIPLPVAGSNRGSTAAKVSSDHQEWLDSGTGQMGDLE